MLSGVMLFKGNSSRLELLIEKIQANKENHEADHPLKALGTEAGSSWRSDTPEDLSRSPSSCATPNSASELPEAELAFTHGVTEATPYPCQFCDKAFPRLSYLKKHEQTHSDQMPFRCEFCSRLFKHKRSRDRHIKLHTGDKKYRCANCEAAFSRSDHLKIHMKTHDTQKPFQCTICTRGYNTAAALTSHMQSHKRAASGSDGNPGGVTGINPFPDGTGYRCLQCGDAFKLPEQLQNHMASVHVNDSPPPPGACSPPQSASSAAAAAAAAAAFGLLQAAASSRPSLPPQSHLPTSLHQHLHHISSTSSTNSITTISNSIASLGPSQQSLSLPPPHPSIAQQLHHLPASAKLACIYCTKDTFTTMEQLQLHVQAMHGSIVNGDLREYSPGPPPPPPPPPPSASESANTYACDLCTMRFASAHSLRKHCNQQHATELSTGGSLADSLSMASGGPPAPLCCAPCALPFASTAQFAEHYLLVHAAAAVAAAVEQMGPTDLSKPKRSRLDYPPQGPLLCNQCSAALPDFEAFRTHLKMHLDGTVPPPSGLSNGNICPHCCSELPTDSRRAELHLAAHFMSAETEYGCQSCLKLFPKQEELQRHLLDLHAHHLYRCALCKDLFDSKVAIQVHFAVKHSNECKLLRCTACPPGSANSLSSLFRSEIEFCAHIRTAHSSLLSPAAAAPASMPMPGHRCPFCRISCNSELEMQLHLAAHAKHYRCPICRESFHVEFLLDRHMHTHHGKPPMTPTMNGGLMGGLSPQDSGSAKPSPRMPTPNPPTPGLNQSLTPPGARCNGQISPPPNINPNDVTENDILLRKSSSGLPLNGGSNISNNINVKSSKSSSVNVSLQCAYCSEVCKTRTELENHMKTHAGQVGSSTTSTTGVPGANGPGSNSGGGNKHKCNICDELCPSAAVLAEHKLTHCKVVGGAHCAHCKSPLTSETDYQQHLRQHQPQLPAACIVCRQTLGSELEARLHARFHLQQSQHQQDTSVGGNRQCCALCLKTTDSPLIPAGTTGVFLCTDCISRVSPQPVNSQPPSASSSSSSTSPNIKTSMSNSSTITTTSQHRCSECQVKFETKEALDAHHLQAHRINFTGADSRLECRLCVRIFPTQTHLQSHLIEHTFAGCGAFTCYLCSAVFTTAHGLQAHMPEHGAASRPYDCPRCGVKFFFRAELDNHAFLHLDSDAANNSTQASAYHEQKRNGLGSVSMGRSPRPASRKGSTSPGAAGESGGGLLPCNECGKQFASPRSLAAHAKNHNNPLNGSEIQVKREFKEEPLENISDQETNIENSTNADEHDAEEDIDVTTSQSDSHPMVSS